MTNAEYARTVQDLLALPAEPVLDLPGENAVNNFENSAGLQTISVQHARQYAASAEALAGALVRDAQRRVKVFGCEPTGAAAKSCRRTFVERFGRRAYRRPLTAAEVDAALALADSVAAADPSPYAGPSAAIEAMITSPKFLFFVENGRPVAGSTGVVRLTGYELAARMAFFLWGRGPDDRLLDAARDGALDGDTASVEQVAAWMIDDARTRTASRQFFDRWLHFGDVRRADRDKKQFPAWSEELQSSMLEETGRLADDLAFREGASFLDLLTARHSYVNGPLAKLYGLGGAADPAWRRVDFKPADRRGGLLTQASFLTGTARIRPKAILRGRFIRESLLCQNLPPPPADVPALEEAPVSPNATEREILEAHRSAPACAGCHSLMDVLGVGMDQYDAIGQYRPTDDRGRPVDSRGLLTGFDAPEFDGPFQLAERLARAPEVGRCVATQVFRYAAGRPELPEDACALERIEADFRASGYRYGALLRAVVRAEAFRHRVVATEEPGGMR